MAVDPAGKWIALGSKKGFRLIDVAAGQEITVPNLTGITDLDFRPVGWAFLPVPEQPVRDGTTGM
jgi:hypothetical protein